MLTRLHEHLMLEAQFLLLLSREDDSGEWGNFLGFFLIHKHTAITTQGAGDTYL